MSYRDTIDEIVEPLMAAVRHAERFLGPEDDWVEEDRRVLYEAAQRHLGHVHTFVQSVGGADYVTTANAPPDAVERALVYPYQRNLASTRKYRTHHCGRKQWADGSFAFDPRDEPWQHHVYLFTTQDDGTDIYAHEEVSVRRGLEHLTTPGVAGDPKDHVRPLLRRHGIAFEQRDVVCGE